jgi:hypothetical protein
VLFTGIIVEEVKEEARRVRMGRRLRGGVGGDARKEKEVARRKSMRYRKVLLVLILILFPTRLASSSAIRVAKV